MLAIWPLVPLPFINPAWISGSSWFMYCWILARRTLSITLPKWEISEIVQWFEHSLVVPFLGIGMRIALQSMATAGFSKFADTSWKIEGEEVEAVTDFLILGSKITVDGDCSHEIRRWLLLGRKAITNLDSVLKRKDIALPTKVRIVSSDKFSSVPRSCLNLCDTMDCSTPGSPIHHQHPKLAQTPVHQVNDIIKPFHPLSSASPPAFNLSQHQSLFKWASSSHQVAKVLEFQL